MENFMKIAPDMNKALNNEACGRTKTKIAVLVSGGGTNLQALIDFEKSGALKDGEIVFIASNKEGAYGLKRAENAGIEALYIEKEGFEEKLFEKLAEKEVQLLVLAGFLKVLSKEFITGFNKLARENDKILTNGKKENIDRIINIHPSLIPAFCGDGFYGIHVHEKALEYGVKVSGATVHFVNEVVDGGKIIAQKAVEVCEGDTPQALQERIMKEAEWKLLPKATQNIAKIIRDLD